MKKLEKTTINHTITFMLFIGGAFGAVIGAGLLFQMIVPYSYPETRILAQTIIAIAWAGGWVLRGWYKNSRDLSVNDMGPVTLATFIGALEQINKNKYGEEK